MNPELFTLIKKNRSVFWSVGDTNLDKLDEAAVVEGILNFGTLQSVKDLFLTLGTKKVATIFYNQISQKRHNYYPQVSNYFDKYFQRHVSINS